MININKNFRNLSQNYIFTEINERKNTFLKDNENAKLLSLGVGDVSLPLGKNLIKVMQKQLKKTKK